MMDRTLPAGSVNQAIERAAAAEDALGSVSTSVPS